MCMLVLCFSPLSVLISSSCNKNKQHNLSQCHNAAMDSYQTSYVYRNEDFEIQFKFSETQNLSMDDKVFLVFTTVQELSRIFTTSSAQLFKLFTRFLKNDKIDLKGVTTLIQNVMIFQSFFICFTNSP